MMKHRIFGTDVVSTFARFESAFDDINMWYMSAEWLFCEEIHSRRNP